MHKLLFVLILVSALTISILPETAEAQYGCHCGSTHGCSNGARPYMNYIRGCDNRIVCCYIGQVPGTFPG